MRVKCKYSNRVNIILRIKKNVQPTDRRLPKKVHNKFPKHSLYPKKKKKNERITSGLVILNRPTHRVKFIK